MPYRTETKIINDTEVKVGTFPAVTGLKLKFKLFKRFGPGLTTLVKGLDTSKPELPPENPDNSELEFTSKNLDLSVLPEAIDKLFSGFEVDEFIKIILELLQLTTIKGATISNEDIFNVTFGGEYGFLYKVLAFVVEVNYKSFLELLPIGKAQKQGQPKPTKE